MKETSEIGTPLTDNEVRQLGWMPGPEGWTRSTPYPDLTPSLTAPVRAPSSGGSGQDIDAEDSDGITIVPAGELTPLESAPVRVEGTPLHPAPARRAPRSPRTPRPKN